MASVNVLVRARPLTQSEVDNGSEVILSMEKRNTYLNYVKEDHSDNVGLSKRESFSQKQFLFDRSYWSVRDCDEHYTNQAQIYNEYGKNVIKFALEGYNACVFAYGQTGSGKTYTMMGDDENPGLTPRICQGLLKELVKMRAANITSRIEISYLEIYNEHCRDLLKKKSKSETPQSLRVREHPKEGPFVEDLSIHPVTDYSSIASLIEEGNSLRVTAGTKMNSSSSRSHSIFTMKLTQAKFCGNLPSETVSKVHLVDLAGSERIAKSGATGIRLKEGGNINKSLTTLGLVISALAENSTRKANDGRIPRKKAFVPYRDSVLTWLLKDSIGGNSNTIMVATVSPASIHYGETLSTLRYASRARKIVNKPVINEDPNVKTIRDLRSEIEKLKKQVLENKERKQSGLLNQESVEAKLKENEEKADKLTKHWLHKITEAQKIFKEKCMSLSQQGHQTVLTSSKIHLMGLDVDPLSTDIVIYHLEVGKTVIGSCDLSDEQGIALEGSGIKQDHCVLNVTPERVTLHSIAGPTYINNQLVVQDWELRQGDVLQFGDFLKFRFHNPLEAAILREKRRSGKFTAAADSSFGRLSPAVMHHYRSLDSGLSSPDDLNERDFSYDNSQRVADMSNKVLNSTATSDKNSPSEKSNSSKQLQPPCQIVESPPHNDLVVLRSSKDIDESHKQKQQLKSASASEILDRAYAREDFYRSPLISFQLNDSKQNEIYLSADNLPQIGKQSPRRSSTPSFSSPLKETSQISSVSDLSLSTDDLAFNFLLQSQVRHSSFSSSVDGQPDNKLSFPSYHDKAQSTLELSPRKFEEETGVNLVHSESLSVLSRRSFNSEEFFVHNDNSGSALAQEAIDAADVLKEKKDQLKQLMESYREAEISRVEIEKENMRRAKENEAIFSKQQIHLEDMLQKQKEKLDDAKSELKEFQDIVTLEKVKQRKNVEMEVDHLLRLKEEHLPYHDWTEHELRKKKFKLKVKIEDYWKRMDLYETLLLELELERNLVKKEIDDKLQEKLKIYEEEQQQEVEELREQIVVSEHDLQSYNVRLDEEKIQIDNLNNDLKSTLVSYDWKIEDAVHFCDDVKIQETNMLTECKEAIEKVTEQIKEEKDKLHHYTIYKMHECNGNSPCYHDVPKLQQEDSLDCKLAEEKQRIILKELYEHQEELETEYSKKVDKYDVMFTHAQDALADLRLEQLSNIEKFENEIEEKKNVITQLEKRTKEENKNCTKLKSELKAHERPRSFVNTEESEEDAAASDQQIEQLLQSKEKVQKILETALIEEFNELKRKGEANEKEDDVSAIDKALSLVFHAGGSTAYIDSLVKKHSQYEQRRRVLGNIRDELQDLVKYQSKLHREVAGNFLTQKSLFEDVRSQERKDIHHTIQTLITDDSRDKDELFSTFFRESERIVEQQDKLYYLENEMYDKIAENYDMQQKLDELNSKLSTVLDVYTIESSTTELENEFETLNAEKEKCEALISQLQERLFEERKEYLELLKSKDGYDVIGQEYRDERQTSFQTEGNKAAADALREVFMGENIMESLKTYDQQMANKIKCGGWTYIGQQKDIWLFRKRTDRPSLVSVMGRGIIKVPPKVVWEAVRNPLSRLIYDKMIKKINIVEHFTDQLKVVYMQHQSRLFLMKQKKDCCCVHNERIERNKYVSTHTSVEHPDCPERKNYSRINVLPSGWVLQPYNENGEDWCLAWYLVQVDVGKGYLPSFFLESIVQKLPLSILSLREYLILS